MLYQWLVSLSVEHSYLNVFRYITFRSFLSFFTAFFVCWFFGPYFIRRLVRRQVGQTIREDGPESHLKKAGTPTMGGGLILFGTIIPALMWVEITNPIVLAVLIITLSFGAIGYIDDKLKITKKNTKGLPGRLRLFLEFAISIAVVAYLQYTGVIPSLLHVPFLKNFSMDLAWGFPLFASLVIVGTANAVNLTDGLDGLAIVPVIVAATTLMLFAYLTGHIEIAQYLAIPYLPGSGELAPLSACLIASGLGFLWYNAYPAQVFMGDVGSLSLGGFLGIMAVLTNNELLMILLGGVFVVEALSVITQVISFKLTGKRIFRMAPIHHHFELKGLDETKIIVRFWIISILLAIICLSTLKLR